jgi:integrase/recombinase XerC
MNKIEVQQFLTYLKKEKRYSPATISSYESDLVRFMKYNIKNKKVTPSFVQLYISYQHQAGKSAKTISRSISAITSFYKHQIIEGAITSNPAKGLIIPKQNNHLPCNINPLELEKLLNFKAQTTLDIRDKAIMELFYSSGLRLSELSSLCKEQLQLSDSTVRVTGKGNKERVLPVGRYAKEALYRWLEKRPFFEKKAKDEKTKQRVFLSQKGTALSNRGIQLRLDYWAKKNNVNQKIHPHSLRHSFAVDMLSESGNLKAVQSLLGHSDLSTTQIYTKLDYSHLAKVYYKSHPRSRKKS